MNTFLLIPLVALIAAVGYLLWMVLKLRQQLESQHSQSQSQQHLLETLQEQLGQVASGEIGMGKRLERNVQDLAALRDRLDELESAQQSSAPYATAIRMAEQGAGVEGLVDACGITQAEAELLLKLHCARENGQSAAH